MLGMAEDKMVWRYRVRDPTDFEKFRVKKLGEGVKITFGKIKNSKRWEIQNYLFEKQAFKTQEQVRKWLDQHLKDEIQMLLDFNSWNESRRRIINAYVKISKVL